MLCIDAETFLETFHTQLTAGDDSCSSDLGNGRYHNVHSK